MFNQSVKYAYKNNQTTFGHVCKDHILPTPHTPHKAISSVRWLNSKPILCWVLWVWFLLWLYTLAAECSSKILRTNIATATLFIIHITHNIILYIYINSWGRSRRDRRPPQTPTRHTRHIHKAGTVDNCATQNFTLIHMMITFTYVQFNI